MNLAEEQPALAGAGAPAQQQSPPQTRFRIERISRSGSRAPDAGSSPGIVPQSRFTVVRVPRPRYLSDSDPPVPADDIELGILLQGEPGPPRMAPSAEDPLIDPFLY
jgi:hypothetical protein